MKKLTVPIAKALAEEVNKRVIEQHNTKKSTFIANFKASKEYKALEKAKKESDKARQVFMDLKAEVLEGLEKLPYIDGYKVIALGYSGELCISINTQLPIIDVDSIKNKILIEDYTLDGSETSEQLVARITAELTK